MVVMEPIPQQNSRSGGWGLLRTLLSTLAVAILFRILAYHPFLIPSGSMTPTLLVGDYMLVSKTAYGYSRYSLPEILDGVDLPHGRLFGSLPERGDVAVFQLPGQTGTNYVKRVVGLPGDIIQVRAGILHINGIAVGRSRIGDFTLEDGKRAIKYEETLPGGRTHVIIEADGDHGPLDNTPEYEVPEGHVFVMGDNRDDSQDSRVMHMVGYIPVDNLVGEAKFIFFSLEGAWLWQVWHWASALRPDRLLNSIE